MKSNSQGPILYFSALQQELSPKHTKYLGAWADKCELIRMGATQMNHKFEA